MFDLKDNKSIIQLLFKGAASSFAVKTAGVGLAFILQVTLARITGKEEYGLYTYVIAWVTIASMLSPLGINRTAVKFIPSYIASKNYTALRSYIHWALLFTLITSMTVSSAAALGLNYSAIITDNNLLTLLLIGCILIPLNAIAQLGMEIIRAFHRVILAEFSYIILRPLLIIVGIFIWHLYTRQSPTAATVIYANIFTGIIVLALLYQSANSLLKPLPKKQLTTSQTETRLWLATALPLLFVVAGNLILGRTDIIMLGIINDTTDSGLYNAASRISLLISLPLLSINMIIAPMIAQLHAHKRIPELRELVTKAAWFGFLSCAVLAIFVFLFSGALLALFGPAFSSQESTLKILLIGLIISSIAGPAGYLLAMTGNQKILAAIVGLAAVLNILLNYLLIPSYGTVGAAIATTSSLSVSSIAMTWAAINRIKINPSIVTLRV